MSLRIGFDLDGVLADMESELVRQADAIFGEATTLWRHAATIENFWQSLNEIEPGVISRLAEIAADRRWEIIFLAERPHSAGATVQVQSQRWLESKGFALPSVYVVHGSRGKIAAALGLDLVIGASSERCIDVVENSDARTILVWRGDKNTLPVEARRPEINIVTSFGECLDLLTATRERDPQQAGLLARVKRMLGLKAARV